MWRGYLHFYHASVDAATTNLTFARLTGGAEPMGGFLARDKDGAAIGLVHWITHRSCWTAGDYCYLQDLFVAPRGAAPAPPTADRSGGGQGAGARLLARALADPGHEHEAMRLYDQVAERSGFVQYRKMLT